MKNVINKHFAANYLRDYLYRLVTGALSLLFSLFCLFGLAGCNSKYEGRWEQGFGYSNSDEKINGVRWTITWTPYYYYTDPDRSGAVPPSDSKYEITQIEADWSENEQSSKYYKQLAYRYGDSSVYVTHKYKLNGSPIGDGWYEIEETIIISNGWDADEIFSTRTTRYEEKLIFAPYLPND